MIKLFGILDIIAAIVLILLKFNIGETIGLVFAIYLLVKGIIFIKNIASIIDIISAIFIILAVNHIYLSITWIFVLWLSQKGIFSLLS